MSILNVNQIQPVGGGNTITVSASDVSASGATITATSFVGDLTGDLTGNVTGNITGTTSNASGATGDFSIADKIVHTGDTNTAIRFPAADTVTVETAGSEALRITSNNKIGIDSTSPHRQLVVGDGGDISCFGTNGGIYFGTDTGGFRNNGAIARAQQNNYHVSGSQVGDLVMAPEADKDLIFSSGSTNTMYERLRITTGGVLSIGENDPSPLGGEYRGMDVGYKGSGISGRTGNPTFTLRSNIYYDGSNWKYGEGNTTAGVLSIGGAQLIFDAAASGTAGATATISERLRIDSSGRLLKSGQASLTSTTLSYPIQVAAASDANAIAIFGRAADDIGELAFYEADKSTKLGELQYRQDHLNFRHRVGDIRFATGGVTERLRITSEGYPWIQNKKTTSFTNNSTVTILTIGSINNAVVKFIVQASDTGYRQHEWAGEYTAFVSDANGSPGVSYYLKEHWQDFGSGNWSSPTVTVSINGSGQVQFNANNHHNDAAGAVHVFVLSVTSITSTIPTIS